MAASFKQAAAALGLKDTDPDMMTQASQLWEMMDDMAASNPESYQKFINKQMADRAEHLKMNAPPTPKFLARCKNARSDEVIWMNFSESNRVGPQPDNHAPINVVVLDPTDEVAPNGAKILLYEVAMHPEVWLRIEADAEFKSQIVDLGLDCVEQRSAIVKERDTLSFDRKSLKLRGKPFVKKTLEETLKEAKHKSDAPFEMKMPGMESQAERDSASRPDVAKIDVKIPGLTKNPKIENKASDSDITIPGSKAVTKAKPVIEEISQRTPPTPTPTPTPTPPPTTTTTTAASSLSSSIPTKTPSYTCVANEQDSCFNISVILPGVSSVQQIALDVSETMVSLSASNYSLDFDLPRGVNVDETKAKFKKKLSCLLLTLPFLS